MTAGPRPPRARRKGVLFVDDERLATKYFESRFGPKFPVFIATSARQALELMERHGEEIGVVISDERMPECTGINLLASIRRTHPQTVRILTTAYTEMETVLEAINIGSVFAFVAKPWKLDDLETLLQDGLVLNEKQTLDAEVIGSKLEELREQLVESHVHDIGVIATRMGHYVGNALCPVTFLLDQLIDGGIANHYPPDFLQEVRESVDELVQTLRDLERAGQPAAAATHVFASLPEAIDDALRQTAAGRREMRHEVRLDLEPEMPAVFGSREELVKLFRFLFAEQIVSLPKGSPVILRGRRQSVEGGVEGIEIEVEDFESLPETIEAGDLLYPFSLRGRNPREFGVFLACCYMIVRRHGGSFSARAKNQGVVYSVWLPYDYREAGESVDGLRRRLSSPPSTSR